MPTEFIDEDHLATGSDLIFGNVKSCTAIIAVYDGTLILGGIHATVVTSQVQLNCAAQHLNATLHGTPSQLYAIGNLGVTACRGGRPALFNALREAFNCQLRVRWRDTPAPERPGIAVQFKRAPNGAPELRIAPPGQWTPEGSTVPSARNRFLRQNGTLAVGTQYGMVSPARLQDGLPVRALGSLEIG